MIQAFEIKGQIKKSRTYKPKVKVYQIIGKQEKIFTRPEIWPPLIISHLIITQLISIINNKIFEGLNLLFNYSLIN